MISHPEARDIMASWAIDKRQMQPAENFPSTGVTKKQDGTLTNTTDADVPRTALELPTH